MILKPIRSCHCGGDPDSPNEDLALTRGGRGRAAWRGPTDAVNRYDASSPNAKTCQLPAPADTLPYWPPSHG